MHIRGICICWKGRDLFQRIPGQISLDLQRTIRVVSEMHLSIQFQDESNISSCWDWWDSGSCKLFNRMITGNDRDPSEMARDALLADEIIRGTLTVSRYIEDF